MQDTVKGLTEVVPKCCRRPSVGDTSLIFFFLALFFFRSAQRGLGGKTQDARAGEQSGFVRLVALVRMESLLPSVVACVSSGGRLLGLRFEIAIAVGTVRRAVKLLCFREPTSRETE